MIPLILSVMHNSLLLSRVITLLQSPPYNHLRCHLGVTADISMFAGSVKLQKSLFDCTLAPWDAVVTALTSNTVERSQSVTLIFERELE